MPVIPGAESYSEERRPHRQDDPGLLLGPCSALWSDVEIALLWDRSICWCIFRQTPGAAQAVLRALRSKMAKDGRCPLRPGRQDRGVASNADG